MKIIKVTRRMVKKPTCYCGEIRIKRWEELAKYNNIKKIYDTTKANGKAWDIIKREIKKLTKVMNIFEPPYKVFLYGNPYQLINDYRIRNVLGVTLGMLWLDEKKMTLDIDGQLTPAEKLRISFIVGIEELQEPYYFVYSLVDLHPENGKGVKNIDINSKEGVKKVVEIMLEHNLLRL